MTLKAERFHEVLSSPLPRADRDALINSLGGAEAVKSVGINISRMVYRHPESPIEAIYVKKGFKALANVSYLILTRALNKVEGYTPPWVLLSNNEGTPREVHTLPEAIERVRYAILNMIPRKPRSSCPYWQFSEALKESFQPINPALAQALDELSACIFVRPWGTGLSFSSRLLLAGDDGNVLAAEVVGMLKGTPQDPTGSNPMWNSLLRSVLDRIVDTASDHSLWDAEKEEWAMIGLKNGRYDFLT